MSDDPIDPAVVEPQAQTPGDVEPTSPEAEPTDSPIRAFLVLKRSGAETDFVFELSAPCVVGRFDAAVGPVDVDLGSIEESVYVSRKHARITCEDGAWKVTDLGSSNGTFVLRDDFERIDEAELTHGTELAFGNARFIFKSSQDQI